MRRVVGNRSDSLVAEKCTRQQEWEAFDALPERVRYILMDGPFVYSSHHILMAMRQYGFDDDRVIEWLKESASAQIHRAPYGHPYYLPLGQQTPHVEADATIMYSFEHIWGQETA